jgi:hypothetical protein
MLKRKFTVTGAFTTPPSIINISFLALPTIAEPSRGQASLLITFPGWKSLRY